MSRTVIKFLNVLLAVLVIVFFAGFAIENRDMVNVRLFPFSYSAEMRKFLLVISCIIFGVFVSGIFMAFRILRVKRQLKAERRQAAALQNELQALKAEMRPALLAGQAEI